MSVNAVLPAVAIAGDILEITGAGFGITTLTDTLPVAMLYVATLDASGVYVAVSVSVPTLSAPAGILKAALPPKRVIAPEL